MRFQIIKASDRVEKIPTFVEIESLEQLQAIQKSMIEEEIKRRDDPSIETYNDLIWNSNFNFELIVNFENMTIVFYNYWQE